MRVRNGPSRPDAAAPRWDLRLYVVDETPRAILAFENVKRICENRLHGRYRLKVIDLLKHPAVARSEQIVAVPALVRRKPSPRRMLIGDLSNTEKFLSTMGLS